MKIRRAYLGLLFLCACTTTPLGSIKTITADGQPSLGPYSHAVRANGLVFLSGIVAYNAKDKAFAPANIKSQTHQVFANVKSVLAASGSTLDDVVKVTVFLKNPEDFAPMNTIYATYFDGHKPARTTVPGVDWGREDMLIEIDVVAKAPD